MSDENESFNIEDMEKDLSVMDTLDPLHCVFFSAPKVGKTRLACTFPSPLLVDFEKGELTVRGKNVKMISYMDVIDEVHIETFMDSLYDFLAENLGRYETIIFDTVTEMMNIWLRQFAETAAYNDPQQKRISLKNYQDDYGQSTNWLRDQVRRFKGLPKMHVVFNCHMREDEDHDKVLRLRPDLTPASGKFLMGQVSVIGYLSVDKNSQDRFMLIKSSHRVTAGARIREDLFVEEVPDELVNPDFEDIADLVIPEWREVISKAKAKTKIKPKPKSGKATKKKKSKK